MPRVRIPFYNKLASLIAAALPARGSQRLGCCALMLGMSLAGCASYSPPAPSAPSFAYQNTATTTLGRGLAPQLAAHPGESAVHLLGDGLDAFLARSVLAQAAERSLDVQYYLFHDDATGRHLAYQLLMAADRGVRVRLLLDDMDMAGRDLGLASLALHPNIEIRLFNPFPSRSYRTLDYVRHFGRVTRRMHNKSFTIDNQLTIVGGRNIGDRYFEAGERVNFGDLDVLAAGPVVQAVSEAFDAYWNSELAVVPDALGSAGDRGLLERARKHLAEEAEQFRRGEYYRRLLATELAAALQERRLDFVWGPARLIYDRPEKVLHEPADRSTHMGPELLELIASARSELIIISPYFVPGEEGAALMSALVDRGVRVTVLTNSLAATDVPAVHAGYARYRRQLVDAGVELYETRPSTVEAELPGEKRRLGQSLASLHAKTIVIDRERILVGSMNFDPRSDLLNTEMGIVFENPALAARLSTWRDRDLPFEAWRIAVRSASAEDDAGDELVWIEQSAESTIEKRTPEPEAGAWARLQHLLFSLLPIEDQL